MYPMHTDKFDQYLNYSYALITLPFVISSTGMQIRYYALDYTRASKGKLVIMIGYFSFTNRKSSHK